MDYDQTAMPDVYDAGRGYAPHVLEMWLRTVASAVGEREVDDILDLGCGTGRYSAGLARHFQARVIAVDPSQKMLEMAKRKDPPGVCFLRGSAEDLPIADASVDLVFISMVVHHFCEPPRAAAECRRVLRPGGSLCVRAGASDRAENYPYVPFFPRTGQLIRQNLLSVAETVQLFETAGLIFVEHQIVASMVATGWRQFAEKTAYRADSILQRLSDAEFEAGLAALRRHGAAQSVSEAVLEPIDFLTFRRA